MSESNIYITIWQKYRPVLLNKMKLALTDPQEYQMSKHEFESIGGRVSAGYAFNLEVNKGVLANKIGGTAIARDLLQVLRTSATAKELMMHHYFKINLTKDCKLKVQIIQPKVEEPAEKSL
jgi:hypothetical protein